jgi:PKHD-type hydroxylase
MHTLLKEVLSANDLAEVKALLSTETFIDGRATSLLAHKKNLQLPLDSPAGRKAGALIVERLRAHETFSLAVQPLAIHPPLFSRYEEGMEYPEHIDVGIMGGMRTDVALTLFLSDREAYEGGELVVNTGIGSRSYRLDAGDAIAYPATTIHQVARVRRGTRLVAVLWAQSLVRDPARREILYDLGLSLRSLANSSCGPRLLRSYWNLVRLWAETAPAERWTGTEGGS